MLSNSKKQHWSKTHLALVQEWHPVKNGDLQPKDVLKSASTKVWWQCLTGNLEHIWQASVADRTKRGGTGCPFCAGQKVSLERSLATKYPDLAKEFNLELNNGLIPEKVMAGSNKKYWWFCKERGHVWQASIHHRLRGDRCPKCFSKTSQTQIRFYCELKQIFKDTEHRARVCGEEVDIAIPSYKCAVEIDPTFTHKDSNRFLYDIKKNKILEKDGWFVLRVRGKGLESTGCEEIFLNENSEYLDSIKAVLIKIQNKFNLPTIEKSLIEEYSRRKDYVDEIGFKNSLYMLSGPEKGKSLADLMPTLVPEWHPNRNGCLTPEMVSVRSNLGVWWQCRTGHPEHIWEATIDNRSNGSGCPFCSGRNAWSGNCLATKFPEIASQWHPTRNGNLKPTDVPPFSGQKVWWLDKDCGHEWDAPISNRTSQGQGCPCCDGKRSCRDNCLSTTHPHIAKEWIHAEDGKSTPNTIAAGSHRRVKWQGKCGHPSWISSVKERTKAKGCPFCSGKRVCHENCLATKFPKIASQWHPTKNSKMTPLDVPPGARDIVWWVCQDGHEWKSSVSQRVNNFVRSNGSSGCETCRRKKFVLMTILRNKGFSIEIGRTGG